MGRPLATAILVSVALCSSLVGGAPKTTVEPAASRFGAALVEGDLGALRALLPRQGKVRAHLRYFGPERGSLSAGQIEALLKDFLREGRVHSFETLRVQAGADASYAVVRARVTVTDRDGVRAEVFLHLSFQSEGERWVLREMRETPP